MELRICLLQFILDLRTFSFFFLFCCVLIATVLVLLLIGLSLMSVDELLSLFLYDFVTFLLCFRSFQFP